MKLNIKFDGDFHKKKIKQAVERVQEPVMIQIAKDSNKYIPKDTGSLESSVWGASNFRMGKLIWATEYAAAIYFGTQSLNRDKNPLASHLWFEVAKSHDFDKWVRIAENAIKSNL